MIINIQQTGDLDGREQAALDDMLNTVMNACHLPGVLSTRHQRADGSYISGYVVTVPYRRPVFHVKHLPNGETP